MHLLFREFVFCDCGRPAMHRSQSCRTCYEDGLRRKWREDAEQVRIMSSPDLLHRFNISQLREMAPSWRAIRRAARALGEPIAGEC